MIIQIPDDPQDRLGWFDRLMGLCYSGTTVSAGLTLRYRLNSRGSGTVPIDRKGQYITTFMSISGTSGAGNNCICTGAPTGQATPDGVHMEVIGYP